MLPPSFQLKTPRLTLRQPRLEDIPIIFEATRFPGFNDGMLWDPPVGMEEMMPSYYRSIQAWESGKAFGFAAEVTETTTFIGRISIRPEAEERVWNIGFWVHPNAQKKGFATEMVGAVLKFGFEHLEAKRIEACHALWNKASEAVLHKNGFSFLRYIEKGFQKKGAWVEENLLGITYELWNQ